MNVPMDDGFNYLDLNNVIDPDNFTGIISNKTIKNWEQLSLVKQFPGRITKTVIPIDLARYRMTVVARVEPGVKVELHAHEEPVFRYVVEGELTLNGVNYESGDWILVSSKTPYEVFTKSGYTVLEDYGCKCGAPPNDGNIHIIRDGDS